MRPNCRTRFETSELDLIALNAFFKSRSDGWLIRRTTWWLAVEVGAGTCWLAVTIPPVEIAHLLKRIGTTALRTTSKPETDLEKRVDL